jgi:hypothetical protein
MALKALKPGSNAAEALGSAGRGEQHPANHGSGGGGEHGRIRQGQAGEQFRARHRVQLGHMLRRQKPGLVCHPGAR